MSYYCQSGQADDERFFAFGLFFEDERGVMRGHLRGLDLDIFIYSHAEGVEGTEHAVERLFLLIGEKLPCWMPASW